MERVIGTGGWKKDNYVCQRLVSSSNYTASSFSSDCLTTAIMSILAQHRYFKTNVSSCVDKESLKYSQLKRITPVPL